MADKYSILKHIPVQRYTFKNLFVDLLCKDWTVRPCTHVFEFVESDEPGFASYFTHKAYEGLTGGSEPKRNKAKVKMEASESNFANTYRSSQMHDAWRAQRRFRSVWPESSLSAWSRFMPLTTHKVHSEDSDQTEHLLSLTRVFAVRLKKILCHVHIKSTAKSLIRPRIYAGWSEASLSAHVIV